MNTVRLACCLLLALPLSTHTVMVLELAEYQLQDGAIPLHRNGPFVDPYFSTKALLLAAQDGMAIDLPAQKWIDWLLPRQAADGRFMRYCKPAPEADWVACKEADADDAMMAIWIAFLVENKKGDLPQEQLTSVERALKQLDQLRDRESGVYFISATNRVALLMDNVEIYEAYRSLARHYKRLGDQPKSQAYANLSRAVAAAIERVFWEPARKRYRASTQWREADDFYPDRVAQIYPWLGRMPDTRGDHAAAYRSWIRANRERWLKFKVDEFPWGLVAIAAQRMGDVQSARCWAGAARSVRPGPRWNVLEEAAFKVLQARNSQSLGNQLC